MNPMKPGGRTAGRPASTTRATRDRGMVTVELAAGILLAVVTTAGLVGLSALGVAQATCAESSAQLARQAARGDEAALRQARHRVPRGAVVDIRRGPEGVEARVALEVTTLFDRTVKVSAEAWAAYEPGEGP